MLRLAGPIVLAELGWMGMPIVDTMMVGRLPYSADAIGAVSLGSILFYAIGIFGTAARFSYVLDGLPVWNLNALRIEANWHALGRWNDAPDFGVGAARGWLGGLV